VKKCYKSDFQSYRRTEMKWHFWKRFGSKICCVWSWVPRTSWQPYTWQSYGFYKCDNFIVKHLYFVWIVTFMQCKWLL